MEKPSAKLNKKGKLVTDKGKLKQLYVDNYTERLSHRKVHPGYETLFQLKMYLYDLRLESSRKIKSSDWSSEDINKVLKSLKTGKSGDYFGLIYEIFKPDCISNDLRKSLRVLCNAIKNQLQIPKCVTFTDITSFYKNKGDRNDLENDRGIFGVGKVQSIIEKLIYDDIYDIVDPNMSDCKVGARKNRNIRQSFCSVCS